MTTTLTLSDFSSTTQSAHVHAYYRHEQDRDMLELEELSLPAWARPSSYAKDIEEHQDWVGLNPDIPF